MTTSLILLGLLCGPWLLAFALRLSLPKKRMAALIGVTSLFLFTGIGHFLITDKMIAMLPDFLPQRRLAVYLSGAVEALAGILLLFPQLRRAIAWLLIAMLFLLLPVNIYAAIMQAPIGGHAWGPAYLLIRIPLQLTIAGWIYYHAISTEHRDQASPADA